MKFRKVGDTGLRTSEVVFGGGAVGGLLIDDDRDFRVQGVKRALDLGISWFDTAPSYGNGKSEINLGEILEKFGSDPNISTKVSISEGCSEDLVGQIRRSVESSLLRLGKDKVDIVFLHNPTTKERGDQPSDVHGPEVRPCAIAPPYRFPAKKNRPNPAAAVAAMGWSRRA